MTRIQRLGGQFRFGELDNLSLGYDDTTGHLVLLDSIGETIIDIGNDTLGVLQEHHGYQFRQAWTVQLLSAMELPIGTLLDVSAGNDDEVTTAAVNSTAVVGVAILNPHPIGTPGPICTVNGSVVDIILTAAGVRGQYVATGAVGGQGTCQAGLPAAGRTVGICIENTVGAGLARCIYYRM